MVPHHNLLWSRGRYKYAMQLPIVWRKNALSFAKNQSSFSKFQQVSEMHSRGRLCHRRPKSAKGANFQGLAPLALLALLAPLNPPKADANPIAIPPSTPAYSSDKNSHNANGSYPFALDRSAGAA